MEDKPIRLQLYMARSGVASRRKCEEIISTGKVTVNGKIITELGTKVTKDDIIIYQNRRLYPVQNHIYLMLNKPVRYISSMADDQNRNLAIDLIKTDFSGRIYNVGRLDYMSSGLLLFTSDGEFARNLTHPSLQIEKEYFIETREKNQNEDLLKWKNGVKIEGIFYKIKKFRTKSEQKVNIILTEGKNKELRRLFSSARYKIKRLERIRVGPLHIAGLQNGDFRFLTDQEIKDLKGLYGTGY